MQELYKQLKQYGKVKTNEPLKKHTTFKIGGPADFFVTVTDTDSLISLVRILTNEGVLFFVTGGGSNMLAADEGFRGVVIHVKTKNVVIDGETVVADAGCVTVDIAQQSVKAGLTGFEWGVGVPGTIGGAVRGNAGAMGGEMKDAVTKVEAFVDGDIVELDTADCEFGYRTSRFKAQGGIVLRAHLQLEKTDAKDGMKTVLGHLQYRNTTQPQGWASTGCIFKNVAIVDIDIKSLPIDIPKEFLEKGKIPAGWLVEEAGMKGKKVGNAQVSERHGNFIVNLGDATASDVLELIEKVKEAVYNMAGITLQEEIQIIS